MPGLSITISPRRNALLGARDPRAPHGPSPQRLHIRFVPKASAPRVPQVRTNAYGRTVIASSVVPAKSAGYGPARSELVGRFGDRRHRVPAYLHVDDKTLEAMLPDPTHGPAARSELLRREEERQILESMVKGSLLATSELAQRSGRGIAVRPTDPVAHMRIESGDPNKPQEVKNKTSNMLDLLLCEDPQLTEKDVGAVVHYNPRPGEHGRPAELVRVELPEVREAQWAFKRKWIEEHRADVLDRIQLQTGRGRRAILEAAKAQFFKRCEEYDEEDPKYRPGGCYADHIRIAGPFLELVARPGEKLVGDHDLFAYTDEHGNITPIRGDRSLQALEEQLMRSNEFQGQHGAIADWEDPVGHDKQIRDVVMGQHGPQGAQPLLHFLPDGTVRLGYYVNNGGRGAVKSVWSDPGWTRWMSAAPSGNRLLQRLGDVRR